MKYETLQKLLKFSISKDETRPYLNGVYFDSKLEQAVSTDGYIMTVSKRLYVPEFADKIINFNDMNVCDREFLKYSSILPRKFEGEFMVTIPKADPIIKGKNERQYGFFLKKDQTWEIAINPPQDIICKLNPHFLKPLQGLTIKVKYNGELNPVVFELVEDDTIYVVMPIKV
jgi:hypothetical protein